MAEIRYSVTQSEDDPVTLQNRLSEIVAEGGRVISVTWQPNRVVAAAGRSGSIPSGYTIISEH